MKKAVVQTIEKTGGKPTTASQVRATSLPFWAFEWLEGRFAASGRRSAGFNGRRTELTDAALELSHLARKGRNSDHGDPYVIVSVQLPKEISNEERAAWEKLSQVSRFNPRKLT